MGLDMYLKKRTYIGNMYRKEHERVKLLPPDTQDNVFSPIKEYPKTERISEIIENVAYWRKCNHIHKWFVDNVQDGEDDCREYYVPKESLKELVNICKQVLREAKIGANGIIENTEIVEELLPTVEGFFFGSTEYDEYYVESIKDTIKQLEPLLEEEGDFYYQSSW